MLLEVGEEGGGWGWGGLCRLGKRQVGTQTAENDRLSKPTYRGSVIASLLGTVRRGRNRGYDTCLKITMGLLELKTRSVWVRMENEHEKHAGNGL